MATGGSCQSATNCNGYDPTSTVWDPANPVNFELRVTFPTGKASVLSSFSLKILQKQFDGTQAKVNFEKQGIGVYRNGVLVYSTTQNILASHIGADMVFNFPTNSNFSSDGSEDVKYVITFGLVHQLVTSGTIDVRQVGYDDICILGSCGTNPDPTATATATPATCGAAGSLSNASIKLAGFAATDKYDYTIGTTYTGTATYASGSTTIPAGGTITSTLPNPSSPQAYTVRVFNASCYKDVTVMLQPVQCPGLPCTQPTGIVLTPTAATCTGTTANANAQVAVTGVTGGDKVGISAGATYTGVGYATAQALTAGAYTFTGLPNPTAASQLYTIRTYNGNGDCYTDRTVYLDKTDCGQCTTLCVSVIQADYTAVIETVVANNQACAETCKGTQTIDLKLTKSVAPTTGGTCGSTGTNFVWTLTLTNEGTMAATDIQIADVMSAEGMNFVSATASVGTYGSSAGWMLPTLATGATATLTITTKALKAGTYTCTAQVQTASPLNDPDSTPGNGITTEDDYATATATVTGASPPTVEKEFSPMLIKPNTPTRLTIKLTNNESTPVTLTDDFVDIFPTSPAAMVIAATPSLQSVGLVSPVGITATAGAGSITIPKGTVLAPGLNQVSVEITVPSNGEYCNDIAIAALKTTAGNNCLKAEACILANSDFEMAPIVKKSMSPSVIQTGQNATFTLTIENRNGAVMTLNQDFTDYLPTGLLASGTPTSSCPSLTVTAENSNKEIKIAGGGTMPANTTCTITVPVTSSTAGTYCNVIPMNAVLTTVGTNNNLGNEDIAEACVTVTATPCTTVGTVSFTQSPAGTVTPSAAVTLTATATGIGTNSVIQWAGASGTFSNVGINPTVWTAPATAGTYTYSVTANNNLTGYGTCTATATGTISVATPATPCTAITAATATVTPTSIAIGASATLDVTATASGTPSFGYSWSGTGGFTATTQSPSTGTLSTAGGYSYTVTATNANGTGVCTATATTSLTVSAAATPCTALSGLMATATPSSMATGNSSTLNVTGTGITAGTTTFSWAGTGGFTATSQSPSTGTLNTAGGYSYTVTATNANGTGVCTASATVSLTVTASPCSLSGTLTQSVCQNNGTNNNNQTADDYFNVTVSATAISGGASNKFEVVLNANADGTGGNVQNVGGTTYGQSITINGLGKFQADGTTTYVITIRDIDTPTCKTTRTTALVFSCSNNCPPNLCAPTTVQKN